MRQIDTSLALIGRLMDAGALVKAYGLFTSAEKGVPSQRRSRRLYEP